MEAAPVCLEGVSHWFGSGSLRRQVLRDVSATIRSGEIVIVTGPSGSGKTTALTLIGALRSAQQGSVQVLGQELRAARTAALVRVRRRIGYIFQQHNLLDALSAAQNVEMALSLQGRLGRRELRRRAAEMLAAVGLSEQRDRHPPQLSGGQRQRVAIARALVGRPQIVLADEPTASLDKASGREVVALMESLARDQGVTVVLVTHDNRILDVADRILHLEDGRLSSFSDAVLSSTRHMMDLLARYVRKGELTRRVADMPVAAFHQLLEGVTEEARTFLRVSEAARSEAFEGMLEQALEAFTLKIGEILDADRASLWLLDEARGELWSKGARDAEGRVVEIRIGQGSGIAGAVLSSGRALEIPDAYADPRFDPSVDRSSGYRTRSILCVPCADARGRVFGVAQILNRRDGKPFDGRDLERFAAFVAPLAVILESWWRMSQRRQIP